MMMTSQWSEKKNFSSMVFFCVCFVCVCVFLCVCRKNWYIFGKKRGVLCTKGEVQRERWFDSFFFFCVCTTSVGRALSFLYFLRTTV